MLHNETIVLIPGDHSQEPLSLLNSFLNKAKIGCFHTLDFLRISGVTEALFSRWLIQFFRELSKYKKEPSVRSQETWVGYLVLSMAGGLAITTKLINHFCERYPAAQDYLFSIFTSSIIYYILDMLSETGKIGAIPLPIFAFTSAIAIPIIAGFFLKLVITDSLPYLTPSVHTFAVAYPNAHTFERVLNIMTGLSYGIPALTSFFWCLNRELHNKTVPLENWQILLLFLSISLTARIGYQLTEYPIFFQRYVALSKAMRDGSLNYACLSGFSFLIGKENCGDKKICINKNKTNMLTAFCLIYSASMALFSLMTTEFQFEKNHKANESLILTAQNAVNKVKNGVNSISTFFKKCCGKSEFEQDKNIVLFIP